MQPRVVHFLLHVPKCAGTTVEAHFSGHLGPAYLQVPRWTNPLRDVVGNRYPGLAPAALAGVQVASGHSLSTGLRRLFPGAQIRESVLLRDPVSFFRSLYGYRQMRHEQGTGPRTADFAAWYRGQRRNPVSRFLLGRYFEQGVPAVYRLSSAGRLAYLEQRLAGFHFVAGWRRADEMIAGLSAELGVPGQTPARNVTRVRGDDPVSPAMAARILAENALDQALFERWKDRGWSGSPAGAAPALAVRDQLAIAGAEALSAVRKKIARP